MLVLQMEISILTLGNKMRRGGSDVKHGTPRCFLVLQDSSKYDLNAYITIELSSVRGYVSVQWCSDPSYDMSNDPDRILLFWFYNLVFCIFLMIIISTVFNLFIHILNSVYYVNCSYTTTYYISSRKPKEFTSEEEISEKHLKFWVLIMRAYLGTFGRPIYWFVWW